MQATETDEEVPKINEYTILEKPTLILEGLINIQIHQKPFIVGR